MESITLKKNSWHYWLVKHLTQWERLDDQNDFCKYCRYVFGSMILATMLAIIAAATGILVLAALANDLYLLYSGVFTGHFHALKLWGVSDFFSFSSGLTAILLGAFLLFFGIFVLYDKYEEYKASNPEPSNSFISNAYRSIKNKICFKVTFQNKE